MKKPRLSFIILLSALVSLSLSSCKTGRSIVKAPVKEKDSDYLVGKMNEQEFDFTWMEARLNVSFILDKQQTDINGQIRIRKDSVIWLTLSPALGIEASRMLFSQDSIHYLNRLDKTFFQGEFGFLNELLKTNIDFDMLQAFITGNDFQLFETSSFRATVDGDQYKLLSTGRRKMIRETRPRKMTRPC